ncbi:MAG: S8 family serine peptidase [Acidobacteriota bacterium]
MSPSTMFSTRSPRHLAALLCGLCLALAAANLQARELTASSVHFLDGLLSQEGVAYEDIAAKIQPQLLAELETSAEAAYKNGDAALVQHEVLVSLGADRGRRARQLAEKSGFGLETLQREVAAVQNRVLRAVATKERKGFKVRYRYETVSGFSAEADARAIAALALQHDVTYIETAPILQGTGMLDGNSDQTTDTTAAHNMKATGAGVTVAVIDSGIDYTHWRLGGGSFPNSKVVGGYDFADDDADPGIDCNSDRHGTGSAFVAAGDGGVAPDAKIVHLKTQKLADCGTLSMGYGVTGAIDWAITHKATYNIGVISMSMAWSGYSIERECTSSGGWSLFRQTLENAHQAGIVIVAASGNDGYTKGLAFPACHEDVIGVGAVYDRKYKNTYRHSDCKDKKPKRYEVTCYSNSATFLDILAPGTCAKAAKAGGGTLDCYSGTSAAAPFIAGVAAIVRQVNPTLTPDEVLKVMVDTGRDSTDPKNGITKPVVNSHYSALAASWWPYY